MSNKRYTEEFRAEAVKQVTDRGHSVAEVAGRLGISIHSLYAWRKAQVKLGAVRLADTEQAAELRRVKSELRRVTEERDILKNRPHGTPRPLWVETSGAATAALIRPIRARMGGATLSVRSGSAR